MIQVIQSFHGRFYEMTSPPCTPGGAIRKGLYQLYHCIRTASRSPNGLAKR